MMLMYMVIVRLCYADLDLCVGHCAVLLLCGMMYVQFGI